jgi:hypothetical protein
MNVTKFSIVMMVRRGKLTALPAVSATAIVATSLSLSCTPVVAQQQSQVQLDEIIVEGTRPSQVPAPFAGGQVATGARIGALGNTDIAKTPFSVTSYTEQFIRDRQARTASEALALDPSVRATRARARRSIRSISAGSRSMRAPAARSRSTAFTVSRRASAFSPITPSASKC